jgi:hypothetical protein
VEASENPASASDDSAPSSEDASQAGDEEMSEPSMEDEESAPVSEALEDEESGGENPASDAVAGAVLPYAKSGQSAWSSTGETCSEPDEGAGRPVLSRFQPARSRKTR